MLRRALDELTGGGVAALVVLTQAMAFGVALYTPYAATAAAGAAAGLFCAIALTGASVAARGTAGLISAPTGPSLVMLVAIATNLSNSKLAGFEVLAAMSAIIVGAGLIQCLLGLVGGGRVVKLVPVPVVAGFMIGSGILMIASQSSAATGGATSLARFAEAWYPLASCLTVLIVMMLCRRFVSWMPPVLPGLVCGLAVFHTGMYAQGTAPSDDWMVGALPPLQSLSSGLELASLSTLPWMLIAVSSLFLAAFTALDTLLTSLVADTATGERHDARRELIGQGVGHIISGLLGGTAGAGTTAATVVSIKSGGRWAASALCALAILALMLWAGEYTRHLPIAVLAGVIVYVALGLIEKNVLVWWQRKRTRPDALIAILVATVTVSFDLMLAVGVGVAITIIRFVTAQVRAPIVHSRNAAPETRSFKARNGVEEAALQDHASRVVLYELRGTLVFATADRLFEELLSDIDSGCYIVLSMRRVTLVDLTGMSILRNMCDRARRMGGEIVFANVHKRSGMTRKVAKTLERAGMGPAGNPVRTFKSSDVAIEYAENKLLNALGVQRRRSSIPLEESQLCSGMTEDHVATLKLYLSERTAERGKRIYEAGKPGGALYVLLEGDVDLRLLLARHHWTRIARMGPGAVFGEVSFHTPGAHTATAVVTHSCHMLVLERDDFDRLADEHPAVAVAVLDVLGKLMGHRLRRANNELLRLNQF